MVFRCRFDSSNETFGDPNQLGKKIIELAPVAVIFCKLAVLTCEDVLCGLSVWHEGMKRHFLEEASD